MEGQDLRSWTICLKHISWKQHGGLIALAVVSQPTTQSTPLCMRSLCSAKEAVPISMGSSETGRATRMLCRVLGCLTNLQLAFCFGFLGSHVVRLLQVLSLFNFCCCFRFRFLTRSVQHSLGRFGIMEEFTAWCNKHCDFLRQFVDHQTCINQMHTVILLLREAMKSSTARMFKQLSSWKH